jgi:hypothetical protein
MTSAENEFSDLETKENEKNDESNSEFSRIDKQRDMNAKENEGARQETDLAIEKTMVFAATENELIGQEYIVRNSETQSELDKANLLIGVNAENDAKLAPENGLALIAIEDDILLVETASSTKAENHTKEIAEQVVKVNEMISEADEFRELDHQESITKMEEALTEVEDAQFEEFLNENEKYLKNKKEISKINENLTEGEENAEERRTESLSKMNDLEQNSSTMNDIAIESDDLQRQRTAERINVMDQSSAENAEATAQRQENNTDKINNVVIAADLKSNNRDQEQKEKAQSTQEQLNNIESTQPVKVHSANSLGNEYPEGVSQETFKQNDEYGLLVAIVTRRVVVINGEGNVYVRTQTNYNTTYSKNGQPTTEYVWQRETQGGNLKKNY